MQMRAGNIFPDSWLTPPAALQHSVLYLITGEFKNLIERRHIVDGQIGQHLPVQLNVGFLFSMDKPAVVEAAHASGGIDARDPQTPEIALFLPPVRPAEPSSLSQGLFGGFVQFAPSTVKAFGGFQYFFVFLISC
jgi:hypothetical protein